MKRIITTVIIASLLSVISLSAQNVKTVYLIDGQRIENFDGSQLAGKSIVSYTVNDEKNVHVIFTSDYKGMQPKDIKIIQTGSLVKDASAGVQSEVIMANGNDVVYVIDGQIKTLAEFKEMSSSNIESMKVIKQKDDPDFKKYAKEGTAVVMIISTKK